jgi:AcrR family transcriptional regulator
MAKKTKSLQRREDSLSRERIVQTAIELLDESGESGLTFRALSDRLSTGSGAIYWHIASKSELLTAACDAIVARMLDALDVAASTSLSDSSNSTNSPGSPGDPADIIRALALGMFEALDAHPWVGTALMFAPGERPMLRIFECVGRQIRALGVSESRQWEAASALLNYILGISGQNAANAHIARARGLDRDAFLTSVSTVWMQLDANEYPFVRSVAAHLPLHDDRTDFLAGVDLILAGLEMQKSS